VPPELLEWGSLRLTTCFRVRDALKYVKEHYYLRSTLRNTHVYGPKDGFLTTHSTVLSRWRRKTTGRSSPMFTTPSSQATSSTMRRPDW
jgi:hypothetical protein